MSAPFATYQKGEMPRLYIGSVWSEVTAKEAVLIVEVLQRYVRDEIQKAAPNGRVEGRRCGGVPVGSAGGGSP